MLCERVNAWEPMLERCKFYYDWSIQEISKIFLHEKCVNLEKSFILYMLQIQ